MGEKIIIAFLAATFALYLKFYYDIYLENKKLKEFKRSMIRVVEKRLIPKYNNISSDYQDLYTAILNHLPGEKITFTINSYSLKENDLRDYFPLENIIKIFNRTQKVSYNAVLKIEEYIILLNRFSPEILALQYNDNPDDKPNILNKIKVFKGYSNSIISIYEKILADLKQNTFD
ncbi:hypothetical protein [Myroides odoratus]|uniref:hypothetical protein n=1 Tax=Myroides odoratus TaxID=256 RepID=UPI00333FE6CD